ncbi:signal peptidase I [candidate division LCP-89 bacterium B3_LCP]|uniref:Signal peptidase I n=1 Tax=candidate division LCP-89 bacterium B3_LCP TaxID=2012998 RepID=A0A532UZT8_UNCL8|nr:MAG: signal peptidase I [candidate division LCP-89 bacterium B3_LCP]
MWTIIVKGWKAYWGWLKKRRDKRIARRRAKGAVRDTLEFIVTLTIMVFFIRTTVVEAYRIPSSSMEDTLLIGDFLMVNKFLYGIRTPDWIGVPFTGLGFDVPHTRLPGIREPKRGDIIVFKYPKDPSQNYIKRCVGLPGDTIEIRNKILFVNGKTSKDPEEAKYTDWRLIPQDMKQREIVPYGAGNRDNYGPIIVPDEHYFMMGDNRDNSSDSRYWGFLSHDLILGKALIIYFSWDKFIPFYRFYDSIRWKRIASLIE